MNDLTNRVKESSILTFDLEDLYPHGERVFFDIAPALYQGLILREKDLKEFLAQQEWDKYHNKFVAIACSCDAIVPNWAFLQVLSHLTAVSKKTIVGTLAELENFIWEEKIEKFDFSIYAEKRVVIKGCGRINVPLYAYARACERLQEYAKLLFYGEACSNVPVWKKK